MNKGLAYAENQLGVHACYESANKAHNSLDEVITALDKAQDKRRTLTEAIADREADLLGDEWGKHPDMAASRMDHHMRLIKRKDSMLVQIRMQLNEAQSEVTGLEYDADVLKQRIKIESARMEELGGYLSYLAAIKQAEITEKTKNQETQE